MATSPATNANMFHVVPCERTSVVLLDLGGDVNDIHCHIGYRAGFITAHEDVE